jgi:SRSO17 transposase
VTPHVLRHNFASIANDLGFGEVTIAALVGLAKASVTSKYIHRLVVGHADRVEPLRDYCSALLATEGRRSVEPMTAVTAPSRVSARHQRLLRFATNSSWLGNQRIGIKQNAVLAFDV